MPGRHRGGQRRRQEANTVDRNAVGAVFGKTKMCKFHIMGTCMKGTDCGFAHSPDEMRALPDLSCTKFCKALINTGVCNDPQCKYAHNREELRCSSQVSFGHGQVLLPPDVMLALREPTSAPTAECAQANQENVYPVQQGWSSPSCFFEQTVSGQLRRAMKSFGSNLALIQEEAKADESDEEKPFDYVAHSLHDGNFLPLGELTVKNTFVDIAAPDKPVKLGLRAVQTAGGRLDALARLDSDGSLALIQEEAKADESDDEKPFDHVAHSLHDGNFLPLGELTVKNTFVDIAAPDEPVKVGLRTVQTAGGRLDALAQLDSDDDE